MKTKMRFILSFMVLLSFGSMAQNQKELFSEWKDVEISYLYLGHTQKYKLALNNWDDPNMWNVSIVEKGDDPNKYPEYYAIPDQKAHPIFLTNGTDWGDDKMKYYRNFTSSSGKYLNTSIIIVNDLLYEITEQKDHTWKAERVYTKEQFKGIKGMFQFEKRIKELEKVDHNKIINDYINSQKSTLEGKKAAYQAKHKEFYDRLNIENGWAKQDIADSQVALQQHAARLAAEKNKGSGCTFTVKNTSFGGWAYIIKEGDKNSTTIYGGKSMTFDCDEVIYYYSSEKHGKLGKIGGGDDSCKGKVYNVQSKQ